MVDPQVKKALSGLKNLNLRTCSANGIEILYRQLGNIVVIQHTIRAGERIIRGRNGHGYMQVSDFSYNPAIPKAKYGRANLKNMTMFYASYKSEMEEQDTGYPARLVVAFETYKWLVKKSTKCYQPLSYGLWEVTQDIILMAIVHHKTFQKRNKYTNELANAFQFALTQHPDLADNTIAITDFFAKEFANKKANEDCDYKFRLSASITDWYVQNGGHGVLYPSVRANVLSFNVAISPAIVNSSLRLIDAAECSVYKNMMKAIIDNERSTPVSGSNSFNYTPILFPNHMGQDEVLKHWDIKSIGELSNSCSCNSFWTKVCWWILFYIRELKLQFK